MDTKNIEKWVDIINVQIEIVKFLAECEKEKSLVHYIPKINTYSIQGNMISATFDLFTMFLCREKGI